MDDRLLVTEIYIIKNMKVVIFAGGLGTRLTEETTVKPKPMVEIGGKPILWHIMKIYSNYGFNDFIICLGYKGYIIKEYFLNYFSNNSDITVNLKTNDIEFHNSNVEPFKVTLVETGLNTKTAGRLKQVQKYINEENFMLTYGDGVADINIKELLSFHMKHGKTATMSSVIPEGRFGEVSMNVDNLVTEFKEKYKDNTNWINAGFFVLNKKVFDYLQGDMSEIMWEQQPLIELTKDRELMMYKHSGFWKCMDAQRDKVELEELWNSDKASWRVWS
jgi:glucose-1-phosphate cytidylyltransferase